MAEETKQTTETTPTAPVVVAPGPHLTGGTPGSTRRMMLDVLIALAPATLTAVIFFRFYAIQQLAVCIAGCVAAELLFTAMRGRRAPVGDLSAVVTGAILALSIPATTPWWVALIGAVTAIGLGKVVFGGVGMNIFNPAMVGRAFIMLAFAGFLVAGAYETDAAGAPALLTEATPMTSAFKASEGFPLWRLLVGNVNGSLGETSAIALLLGGAYLVLRRTASWEIPAGAAVGLVAVGVPVNLFGGGDWTVLHHLLGGAFLFGAFFIATDPVSSPLTPKGKWAFGILFGVLVMGIRLLTNYPEGVMFSVLLANAAAPLINRWTIPTPVGGPTPAPAK